MPEVSQIEIDPSDEITLVDTKWLTKNGHGSKSTLKRKMEANEFPKPIQPDGKRKWTIAQIKRHLQQQFSQQTAA
jgi:predicted DNA-binding transcriptional regulator AlpA